MNENYDEQYTQSELDAAVNGGFCIDNDSKAEWAIKKIKEAQDEHDRILALIEEEEQKLALRKDQIAKKLESDTSYLKYLLNNYMQTVTCKESKTQKTYQLLSGKLVYKYGGTEWVKDDDAMLAWAKKDMPELVKVKESVDWAALKKTISVTENGEVITEATGEVLDFIHPEKKPDSMDIKFN